MVRKDATATEPLEGLTPVPAPSPATDAAPADDSAPAAIPRPVSTAKLDGPAHEIEAHHHRDAERLEYDSSKGVAFEKTKSSKYMTDKELSQLPFFQRINWLSTYIIFSPLIGLLLGMIFVPLRTPTLVLAVIQYFLTGLGITAGYHRLWSHRAYKASFPVEFILAMWGAAAFEGSARWWSRNHRSHHRYVDSEQDPYSVHKGFWYAHLGWMVFKQDANRAGRVDISDLNQNKLLRFQHDYYLPVALFFGFAFPCLVGYFGWGDFWGALVYACFGRMLFVHQATFCINSLAHTFGHQTYSKEHTSYDSVVTALITLGEGYHNYHHEFPHDYRNGIRWYHYDPTKWVIRFLSWFGLTSRLVRFPNNEILKAKLQVKQQELDEQKREVDWGIPVDTLPAWTWDEVSARCEKGDKLIIVSGLVHDVNEFGKSHPGGRKILDFWNGRDASQAFTGEVYKHSKAAHNLLAHLRVAKLQEKLE